ncbi:MAG: hypothetical protein GXP45_04145 [bacterium]|nr:hypothetical protein [bacterium]
MHQIQQTPQIIFTDFFQDVEKKKILLQEQLAEVQKQDPKEKIQKEIQEHEKLITKIKDFLQNIQWKKIQELYYQSQDIQTKLQKIDHTIREKEKETQKIEEYKQEETKLLTQIEQKQKIQQEMQEKIEETKQQENKIQE